MPVLFVAASCQEPLPNNETAANPAVSSNSPTPDPDTTTDSANASFEWDDAGFRIAINLNAYVADPDAEGPTHVRDEPDGKIVLKLNQEEPYMVNIIAQRQGWFEISSVTCFTSDLELPSGPLWMHPSVLAATTRNYGPDEKIPVYAYPQKNESFIEDYLVGETEIRFIEFYFDFAHIHVESDGKTVDGWIEKNWICGNPVTTCP